jgi:hypothetical protein
MKGYNGKPIKVKPGMYALFFIHMKAISEYYGYNLLLNGSMDRDMDIVAVPWRDNPGDEQKMIKEFQEYLTGTTLTDTENKVSFTILPGNRHGYIIELNRGDRHGNWARFEDEEFYLDISVVQLKPYEQA